MAKSPAVPAADRRIPPAAFVLGGVGLLGLASFAYFSISGRVQHSELQSSCAPRCSDDEIAPVRTRYLIGDVSLAAAVVSLGAATWLILARRPAPPGARAHAGSPLASFLF
jgi:hypothetical protein